jgi:GT2 family glycosyltransferase
MYLVGMKKIAQIIILSDSKTTELKKITENCLKSLKESENFDFDIYVVDNKNDFEGVKNIKIPGEFNNNKFMNIPAKESDSEWIVFCNNDLIFHKNWFTELMRHKHPVMCSKCPLDRRQKNVTEIIFGKKIGYEFSGWCFTMRRDIYKKIGGLNEEFKFWCADNVTIKQLEAIGITPCIIPKSIVTHLGSQTLNTMPNKYELTTKQVQDFNKKYK